jgi:hypothetical protein
MTQDLCCLKFGRKARFCKRRPSSIGEYSDMEYQQLSLGGMCYTPRASRLPTPTSAGTVGFEEGWF